MLTLDDVPVPEYERVVRVNDDEVGLDGYIAIHSLTRGPSLGGLRIRAYRSPEEALADVLRLSEAMTYKSAAAGLPFGGGKAVIIGEPSEIKTPPVLEQFGRAVDALEGAYITAEDVGTLVSDLVVVANGTKWVAGLPASHGGSGDPSPATAKGVFAAMRSVGKRLWGTDDLTGRKILVQGLGKVGSEMLELLTKAGATVLVADVDTKRIETAIDRYPEVEVIPSETCLQATVDIVSPCALGGILATGTVEDMHCSAVVGSANNQLNSPDAADIMKSRNIVYAPDFIVNAGGIINIASEYGYTPEDVDAALEAIGDTVSSVLDAADRRQTTTHEAAMLIARERLEGAD